MILAALLAACGGGGAPPVTVDPVAPAREARFASPLPLDDAMRRARQRLMSTVIEAARDPSNPWGVKHAWLAVPPDVPLADGTDSVDQIFARHAVEVPVGEQILVAFPAKGRDGALIEPHTDLLLKGLADAGVDPERVVRVEGREHRVGDLWRASLRDTWVDGDALSATSWNDTPWTLHGLAAWAPPGLAWTAVGGRPMTMDALTHAVVARLQAETAFLDQARANGTTVQKRKQGVFAYTCGGAHLLQGAAYAVARGFGAPGDREVIVGQVDTLFWRYDLEMSTVDGALRAYPEHRVPLLIQREKWLGHFLESAVELSILGFYEPDAAQRERIGEAMRQLAVTVEQIDEAGLLDGLARVKTKDRQVWLDLLGDGAHAVHAYDLASGAASVRY